MDVRHTKGSYIRRVSLGIAVLVSTAVALVAWLARTLTRSGAVAASLIGILVLWPTGWAGFGVLGMFCSALGARHSALGGEQMDIGGRGPRQVWANGGVAAVGALGEFWWPGLGVWLVTIVLAAAGADTWATAFGGLSRRAPRDILRRTEVAAGTSGGVTWFGTTGGIMGAGMIGAVGGAVSHSLRLYLVAVSVGVAGMLFDSVLGSAFQARFRCPICDQATERRIHRCGTKTTRTSGWAWLDNDLVNASTTAAAFLAGLALWPTS